MNTFDFSSTILRAADGDGGTGGDGAGAPGAQGLLKHAADGKGAGDGGDGGGSDGGTGDKLTAGDGAPPAPFYPDGLPEPMRGKTDRETIEKLAGDYAARPKPPAKPEEYNFELPAKLKEKYGDLKDDEVLPIWRKVAHKHGLSNKQFVETFVDLHEEMTAAGIINDIDPDTELKKLEPKDGDQAHRSAVAARTLNGTLDFIRGLETRKTLSRGQATALTAICATADGVQAIQALTKMIPGDHNLQSGGNGAASVTKGDVEAMERDPRYSTNSPQYDPAFRQRADTARRQLHGAR